MYRNLFFTFLIALFSCNNRNNKPIESQQQTVGQVSTNKAKDEINLKMKFNSFDTTVDVLFWDTKDSINKIQLKSYNDLVSKLNLLVPEILKKIFEFYKSAYPDYKKGWTSYGNISDQELEKYLPKPTTPEDLKKFITPTVIYIDNKKNVNREQSALSLTALGIWNTD